MITIKVNALKYYWKLQISIYWWGLKVKAENVLKCLFICTWYLYILWI